MMRATGHSTILHTGWLAVGLALTLAACGLLGKEDDRDNETPLSGTVVFAARDTTASANYQLYTMRLDGSDLQQITHFEHDEAVEPMWSPDGRRIAFATSLKSTTLGFSLYLIDADGTDLRPLKRFERESPSALVGARPAWSPDGSKIAFQVCTNCELGGQDYEISVVEVAGEAFDPAQLQAVTDHPASDRYPSWSPDGEQIAFVSNRAYVEADSAPYRTDLYVVNVDGTNLRRLTQIGSVGPPAWSPDGGKIAYVYRHPDPDVFLYDLSTGKTARLTDLKYVGRPMWSSDGRRLLVPATTHEGKHVLQLITSRGEMVLTIEGIEDGNASDGTDWDWYDGKQ